MNPDDLKFKGLETVEKEVDHDLREQTKALQEVGALFAKEAGEALSSVLSTISNSSALKNLQALLKEAVEIDKRLKDTPRRGKKGKRKKNWQKNRFYD